MKLKDTIHDNLWKNLANLAIVLILLCLSSMLIEGNLTELFTNLDKASEFLAKFLKPDFSYLSELYRPILDTLAMSLAGTFLGMIFAIPAAFLGTYIVTENHVVTIIFRAIFSVIRTIPTLLLAAIFVAVFGIGSLTGVITIAVFTFGMVSQLIFEKIEVIDLGPLEAARSVGATKFQIAVDSIWPQVSSDVLNYAFYAFEVNVRSSAVLGYVGAGGIGTILNAQMSLYRYDRVSLVILVILVIVFITGFISKSIRKEFN